MTDAGRIEPPRNLLQVEAARESWRSMPRNVKREVLRHAGRGERHPNLYTASCAYRWACTVIPPDETPAERRRCYAAALTVGLLADVLLGALFGGATGVGAGSSMGALVADRRLARRILRLGAPPSL